MKPKERSDSYSDSYFEEQKEWLLVFLLCFFLGIIGAHRIYSGHIGRGIVYFFTFGLFFIGYVIDLFLILSGNYRFVNGSLLKKGFYHRESDYDL